MSATPSPFEGEIIVHVRITVKPGKGDEMAALFDLVRQSANSDAEPGTLEFRVARYGDEFLLFEKYVNKEAIAQHSTTEAFATLQKFSPDLRDGEPTVLFFEEMGTPSAKL
ncbi:hypothetical protein FRC02_001948 [Tulasnella sp. 418]|nr:hypothetical protein FRC02_001948 [Tulasnella sp. 418]